MKYPATSPTSRLLALNVLCTWHNSQRPINAVFDRISSKNRFEPRDLQLANALIFGVLRQQQYLDFILGIFAKHPLHKMKPRTLAALRLGIFQLVLLDRIPESAAVNETVKAFKAVRQPKWLVNFVNGVLRNVARKKNKLPTPNQATIKGQPILNHPDWLFRRWQQHFGPEKTIAICRNNNLIPDLTLRTNRSRISRNGLQDLFAEADYLGVQPGALSPEALCLPKAGKAVSELPGYEQGYFQVQDEAAQLASYLMPMKNGGNYLDGCAGLGGKTSHLAALAPISAHITAIEPEKRRYLLLQQNLKRLGETRVKIFNITLEQFTAETKNRFDAILLDAPCSGTGVIRRQPDIRWNRRPEDLESYQKQQLQLLDTAASLLQKNGVLVYATCSIEPEENEEVIDAFLRKHPHFSIEKAGKYLPPSAGHLVSRQGYFHSTSADGIDGFFAVRLQRFFSG
jgi:16S rRNA (cytosine967-C5)-methyltransferase